METENKVMIGAKSEIEVCGHNNKVITVQCGYFDNLIPDSEPYNSGVEEEVTNQDRELLDSIELEIGINVCSDCGKVLLYPSIKNIEIV